jgi:hypothetical protein
MFEKRVLRKMLQPKRREVVRGWRSMNNEEFHNLYTSPNIIRVMKLRKMKLAGHVARMGEIINTSKMLVGRSEEKRPVGRSISRCWEDNIIMELREVEEP